MPTIPFLKRAQPFFVKSLKRIQTFFVKLTFANKLRFAYITFFGFIILTTQLSPIILLPYLVLDMIGTYISSFFYNDMRSCHLKWVNVLKVNEYEGCLTRLFSIVFFILYDMIITWKNSIFFLYSPDLHIASRKGHLEIVQQLIKAGADVNVKDKDNGDWTPLHTASYEGHLEIVQELIKAGADVNVKEDNEHGSTPLHVASLKGHLEIVQELIKAGADVNAKTKEPEVTPLRVAKNGGHTEIVNLLIENGAIE